MYKKYVKRILDVMISTVAFIVLIPLLLLVSVIIKLESKGPVLFKQKRIGLDGKVFEILKFRSMCVGAESKGSGVYSGKNDSRVTKVGKFIRATSIDELPQLVNIIKGDMSLIGPRPVLTYHPCSYEEYSKEQLKRFLAKPGVTGLAQLNGRKEIDWDTRIKYDVEYVNSVTFKMDIKLFFLTIVKVLTNADNVNTSQTATKKTTVNTEFLEEDVMTTQDA